MDFKATVDYKQVVTSLDWLVFFAVFLLTIASVIYGQYLRKRQQQKEVEQYPILELLLMGRRLTLPLFVATLVATWYGGIFGVTRIAFEQGIFNFITQGFFWYIAYLIFAIFITHKVAKYKAVTLPDLVNKMFGPKSGKLSGVFNFFNVLPIAYVISLGLIIQAFFGGEVWQGMLVGVTIVILYTIYGGFRAVVFSDLIQ
ncbi:MAG: sodium:solute symporter family protein, partial [Candidatus Cloacimonetes bacterium]|nr:sodium:solute symporter family protein [Candidatus Cloacimonadota bacterium]